MTTARNGRRRPLSRLFLLGIGMLTAVLAARPAAAAGREKVLLNFFCRVSNHIAECEKSGGYPHAGLIADQAGNLYGTTTEGGAHNGGAVFELTPNAAGTAWTQTVLYSFCSQARCADGEYPAAPLIMDGAGNLYGTTATGGLSQLGTVFELTPNADKTAWTEKTIHAQWGSSSGLAIDSAGNLYGTTVDADLGVVFGLRPNATRTAWRAMVLYSFCSLTDCADGAYPYGGLVLDGAGNLYGATIEGGANGGPYGIGGGTLFELIPNATRTAWTETVLYSFCAEPRCADGDTPAANLIIDDRGNLYGTTSNGGSGGGLDNLGFGVVFRLTPNAKRTAWTQTVLHRFCRRDGCADGAYPAAGLAINGAGDLYGATEFGGVSDSGVAFVLTPDKTEATGWRETVLHEFCPQDSADCPDGAYPKGGLVMDGAGSLYGTASQGGSGGGGVVFELEAEP